MRSFWRIRWSMMPSRLWPRKQIEISTKDLFRGLVATFVGASEQESRESIARFWSEPVFVGLCERSCFDIYLAALQLPPKSEVLVSAINIRGMARILEEHNLVPIPVDIDPSTLELDIDQARERIGPQTRAVLFAHLFGTRSNLDSLASLCRKHSLLLWEDCAQVFDGNYRGDPRSDARLFSFGPIKAFSALGGGVLCCDEELLSEITSMAARNARQSNWSYGSRLMKYGLVKVLARPRVFRVAGWLFSRSRQARDRLLSSCFRNTSETGFFDSIRRRPSLSLLRTLAFRLSELSDTEANRSLRGQRLVASLQEKLDGAIGLLGQRGEAHTYWVCPILAENSSSLLDRLDRAGFDATSRCQLSVYGSAKYPTPIAARIVEQIVFLPCQAQMPLAEMDRMAEVLEIVLDVARQAQKRRMERNHPRYSPITPELP